MEPGYNPQPEQPEIDPEAEQFYSGAMTRIVRLMPIVGALATAAVLIRFGWRIAAGFVVGCVIGYVNFVWLKRVVGALADRVTRTGEQPGARAVVTRFLVRYALIALAVCAIFKVSKASVSGMLAGLFLPVGAIACEAAYEVYAALRRGI
jgi:small-conductance mechanosensitive channel